MAFRNRRRRRKSGLDLAPASQQRRLKFESLEHRRLLAITVDTLLDVVDLNDGKTSLREAIFAANAASGIDTIEFAVELTSDGPATILLTQGEIVITEALKIFGPGIELLNIDAWEQSRIFNITAVVGDFALHEVTLINGLTTEDNALGSSEWCGGAIRSISDGSLTLDRVRVANSGTTGRFASGGGVFVRGNVHITDCQFFGNFVTGRSANGGGISSVGDAFVERSIFSENRAMQGAGGAIAVAKSATFERSLITRNAGHFPRQIGGVSAGANIFLNDSVVSNNVGDGLMSVNGDIAVLRSTVSGNSTFGVDSQRDALVRESTVSGNGGGIRAKRHLSVLHSTVYDNHTTFSGMRAGGVFVTGGAGPISLLIGHSIVAGNSSMFAPDVDPIGEFQVEFSLIGDNSGSNLIEAPVGSPDTNGNLIGGPIHGVIDPKLGPLTYNGGPVFLDGSSMLTHALLPGSPAIDAGHPAAATGANGVPEFDQRGDPWSRVAGGRIDIGAYERQAGGVFTLVVDTLADENDGDYSAGKFSLREAIAIANANHGSDTIEFDPVLWAEGPATILLTQGELLITDSMVIIGPGAELLTIDASGNDPTPNSTLMDGDDTNDGDGTRVFNVDDGNGSNNLDLSVHKLTLTGGDAEMDGGAIRSLSAIELIDCVIAENFAFKGGGLFSGSGVSLLRSSVVGNNCLDDGGGIFAIGDVMLVESHVNSNDAPSDSVFLTALGGGIAAGGNVSLYRSSVSENTSHHNGGGMRVSGNVTLVESEVIGNRNLGDLASGGGILANGDVVIDRSVVARNESESAGGGVRSLAGITVMDSVIADNSSGTLNNGRTMWGGGGLMADRDVSILRSTVSGNHTTGTGGGLFVAGTAALSIVDSTISGNTSGVTGGGVYHAVTPLVGGNVSILRTTIAMNEAPNGGGVAIVGHDTSIGQSIIAANTAASNPDLLWNGPSPLDLTYSLIGIESGTSLVEAPVGAPDSNGNLIGGPIHGVIDPKLGPLTYNGGPIFQGGSGMLTHALLPASPAIDAGNPTETAGANGVPEFDQRGGPWSRVAGGRIDIGAVEAQANPLAGDYNFNGVVDAADYVVWRNTVGLPNDLRADGSGPTFGVPDGVVDDFDRVFWKQNFGNVYVEQGGGSTVLGVEVGAGVASVERLNEESGTRISRAQGLVGKLDTGANFEQRIEIRQAANREGVASEVRGDALLAWVIAQGFDAASRAEIEGNGLVIEAEDSNGDAASIDDIFELLGATADW